MDPEQNITVNGISYHLIHVITCEPEMTMVEPQFDRWYAGGNAEAGLKAIVKAGNVYINGIRIPYVLPDGTVSTERFTVNAEDAIWKVDGGWAWKTHKQRNWDEKFFLPRLEAAIGYKLLEPVSLDTAAYLFTKYITHVGGQKVGLYAAEGHDTADLVTSEFINGIFVSRMEAADGNVIFYDWEGKPISFVFPAENVDPQIVPPCMIFYMDCGPKGMAARHAVPVRGRLAPDPSNPRFPMFRPAGSDEFLHCGDAFIGKRFPEQYRPTQFLRCHRRTDQFNADVDVIAWCITPDELRVNGFTRVDPMAALRHAVDFCRANTAGIFVSADGSDVPAGTPWVTPEVMAPYTEKLAECEAVLAAGCEDKFAVDKLIYDLGNVYGGGEDLHSRGPMKMNPLGVMGNAEQNLTI